MRFERATDAALRAAAGAARRLEDLQSPYMGVPASLLPELQVGFKSCGGACCASWWHWFRLSVGLVCCHREQVAQPRRAYCCRFPCPMQRLWAVVHPAA